MRFSLRATRASASSCSNKGWRRTVSLLIRLAGVPMAERAELLARAVEQHGDEFVGAFSVLTPAGLRIRPRLG